MGYHNMFFFLTKKIVVCTIMQLFWSPKRTPATTDVPYSCTPYSTCIVIVMTTFFFPQSAYHPYMKGNIWKNFACGVQNTGLWNLEHFSGKSGIPLKIGIQNPSSPDKKWNPASKTVLDFLTWGNQEFRGIIYFCLRLSDSQEFLEIPFSKYREI